MLSDIYIKHTQIDKNINFLVANKQIHEQFTESRSIVRK